MATLLLIYLLFGYFRVRQVAMAMQAKDALQEEINHMTVPEMIDYIAPKFGVDPALIKNISWCESFHEIKNHDGGRAKNVTGIWDSTFDGWLPLYEKEIGETLNRDSQFDQLKMMSFVFSKGDEYRNKWTTYRAYMNGGKITLWSNYYNKQITVVCFKKQIYN